MPERLDVDVCVVGAGYAGASAALRVHQAGRSVVVVEARDRIGGRIWTAPLADGTPVDRGGAWLAPGHTVMHGLAEEFGIATHRTHVAGVHLLVGPDRTHRYTGLIPKISPLAILSLARANRRIDKMARHGARGGALDGRSGSGVGPTVRGRLDRSVRRPVRLGDGPVRHAATAACSRVTWPTCPC